MDEAAKELEGYTRDHNIWQGYLKELLEKSNQQSDRYDTSRRIDCPNSRLQTYLSVQPSFNRVTLYSRGDQIE